MSIFGGLANFFGFDVSQPLGEAQTGSARAVESEVWVDSKKGTLWMNEKGQAQNTTYRFKNNKEAQRAADWRNKNPN